MVDQAPELKAPKGTFDTLVNIPGHRLGTSRTRRFIKVTRMPEVFPAVADNPNLTPDMAVICLSLRTRGENAAEDDYFFGVDPEDKFTILDSWHFDYKSDAGKTPVTTPPTLLFLIEELRQAQIIELSLKK